MRVSRETGETGASRWPLSGRGSGYVLGLGLLLLWGMFWRTAEIASRGLEYDEIWTLQHYALAEHAEMIFTDLATPNNHPLHSWLVRSAIQVCGISFFSVRLPSWLAGIAVLLVMIWASRRLFRDRLTTFTALAFTACSGLLVHYAETARGYSLQGVLILAFLGAIARRDFFRVQPLQRSLIFIVLIPFAAILTLPTSLVLLCPVCAAEVWRLGRKWASERRRHGHQVPVDIPLQLAAYGVLLALALLWLWHGWSQFQIGKANFGTPIRSVAAWCHFVGTTLPELAGWPVLALAAIGLLVCPSRRLKVLLTGFVAFPLLMAPLTGAGPARTYLPLLLVLIPAAAWGWRWLWGRTPVAFRLWAAVGLTAMLVCLTPRARLAWTPSDWLYLYPAVEKAAAGDAWVCYPATAGYIIRFHFPGEAVVNNVRRIPRTPGRFIQVGRSAAVSGIDPLTGGDKSVPLPPGGREDSAQVQGMELTVFQLLPLEADTVSAAAPSAVILAAIPPEPLATVAKWQRALIAADGSAEWILLNPFFRGQVTRPGDDTPREGQVLISAAVGLNLAKLRDLETHAAGQIRFFRIAGAVTP